MPPAGMHPAPRPGLVCLCIPLLFTALIFIPLMSSWPGARLRRKPGSAGLQLSRRGSIRDAWKKLILLQPPTAPSPIKHPAQLLLHFFLPQLFLAKTEKWKGGESPLSQPLKKSFPGRLGLSSFRKAFPPLYGVWARSCCHLQANQLIIIKPTNKVQLVLSPGPPLPAVGRCLFSSWTSQILTLLLPGEHKGPV